jgi:hypothetical protein
MVSFGSALDAVRFCHAGQAALLFQRWPSDCSAVAGETVLAADGRLLHAGPRVAMAVHTTPIDGPSLLNPRCASLPHPPEPSQQLAPCWCLVHAWHLKALQGAATTQLRVLCGRTLGARACRAQFFCEGSVLLVCVQSAATLAYSSTEIKSAGMCACP